VGVSASLHTREPPTLLPQLPAEAKYAHPSDSYLDLIFARRGGFLDTAGLLLRYLVRAERGSPLYDYIKVRRGGERLRGQCLSARTQRWNNVLPAARAAAGPLGRHLARPRPGGYAAERRWRGATGAGALP
jgi:hypothetical protein